MVSLPHFDLNLWYWLAACVSFTLCNDCSFDSNAGRVWIYIGVTDVQLSARDTGKLIVRSCNVFRCGFARLLLTFALSFIPKVRGTDSFSLNAAWIFHAAAVFNAPNLVASTTCALLAGGILDAAAFLHAPNLVTSTTPALFAGGIKDTAAFFFVPNLISATAVS